MSELEVDLTESEMRAHKFNDIMSRSPVDFAYWSKVPYWSHDEAVALLLGRNPEIISWNNIERDDLGWTIPASLILDYMKLRNLVLRASEMNEIGIRNTPVVFLEWAEGKGIEIPEVLQQEVAARKNTIINSVAKTEIENLLKIKDEEIAKLQKRIEELEALAWEGFDENLSTYSRELAIAVKAHGVISKNWQKGSSIKRQISMWLQENYPKLSNEEKERIAKMCNWQKSGGAPSTP